MSRGCCQVALRDGSKVSYDLGQDWKTGKSKAENVRAF
jgi:CspA family cold shock protein